MHQIKHGQPLSPLFKPGTILWRPCSHSTVGGTRLFPIPLEKTEKSTLIARVVFGAGDFCWEPTVVRNRGEDGRNVHGVVLFVDRLPEESWTHMVVTGVSKALTEPYDQVKGLSQIKGGAVFATPMSPLDERSYLSFREQMFHLVRDNLNCSFERKVELMLSLWPEIVDSHKYCRLMAEWRWRHPEVLLEYCHLRRTITEGAG